ncbi:hypothetical protein JP0122_03490 [Helicobacter pylori]|nr:hypothetical protein JP0104_01170 [Helicobacter pylori]GHS37857.1 hypothetical protein JP0122_03490 [Helicobacter pylori]
MAEATKKRQRELVHIEANKSKNSHKMMIPLINRPNARQKKVAEKLDFKIAELIRGF